MCFYPENTKNEIFYIRMYYTHFLIPQIEAGSLFRCISKFFFMKIDEVEGWVSTFEVPGSKWNLVLGRKNTISAWNFMFSVHVAILVVK